MKKYAIYILFFIFLFTAFSCKAQLFQFGIIAEADMQNKSNFLHNYSLGLEADINIPVIKCGVSASAMVSMKYFNNKQEDKFDNLYQYLTVPIDLKWSLGTKLCRLVIMAGPYFDISLNDKVSKDKEFEEDFKSSIYGMHAQIGVEFLKKYRLSIGYKRDVILNDLEDYIRPGDNLYLNFLYIL